MCDILSVPVASRLLTEGVIGHWIKCCFICQKVVPECLLFFINWQVNIPLSEIGSRFWNHDLVARSESPALVKVKAGMSAVADVAGQRKVRSHIDLVFWQEEPVEIDKVDPGFPNHISPNVDGSQLCGTVKSPPTPRHVAIGCIANKDCAIEQPHLQTTLQIKVFLMIRNCCFL